MHLDRPTTSQRNMWHIANQSKQMWHIGMTISGKQTTKICCLWRFHSNVVLGGFMETSHSTAEQRDGDGVHRGWRTRVRARQGAREHGEKERERGERDYDSKGVDGICLHLVWLPSCVIISGCQRGRERERDRERTEGNEVGRLSEEREKQQHKVMGGKKESFGCSAMGHEAISHWNTHTERHTLEAVQEMTSILNICHAHREMKEGQWILTLPRMKQTVLTLTTFWEIKPKTQTAVHICGAANCWFYVTCSVWGLNCSTTEVWRQLPNTS